MGRLTRQDLLEECRRYISDVRGAFTDDEQLALAEGFRDLALQSLSKEAVRDEVLEEAARVCDAEALRATLCAGQLRGAEMAAATSTELAKAIRALKREPNAAAPGSCCAQPLPCGAENCTHPKLTTAPAAPDVGGCHVCAGPALKFGTGCALTNCPYRTAPDVESMVKRLRDCCAMIGYATSGAERASHKRNADAAEAALLARLGQAQSRFVVNWTTEGCPKHDGQPWSFTASVYTEIAKRCPLCEPLPGASDD